jgi:hypothetical protein
MARKILVDTRGARLGVGARMPVTDGLDRAHNDTRAVYELWAERKSPGGLPRLADFFPMPVQSLLECCLVVQVLRDPPDYLYTFVGRMEAEARGYDPTGRTVREVFAEDPEVLDFCLGNYLAATGSAGFIDFSIDATPNDRFLEVETLFLPCAEDGRIASHIVVYSHYLVQPD